MKNLFLKAIAGISYLFLFMGIAVLASALFFANKAQTGGGVPERSSLQTLTGEVVQAREVTLETKRRRGPDSKEVFYELDFKDTSGQITQLRVEKTVPREQVEAMLQGELTVQFDASDNNLTYDVKRGGATLLDYDEVARAAQEQANKQAAFFSGPEMYKAAAWWIGLGVAGLFLRRKLGKPKQAAISNHAAPAQADGDDANPRA